MAPCPHCTGPYSANCRDSSEWGKWLPSGMQQSWKQRQPSSSAPLRYSLFPFRRYKFPFHSALLHSAAMINGLFSFCDLVPFHRTDTCCVLLCVQFWLFQTSLPTRPFQSLSKAIPWVLWKQTLKTKSIQELTPISQHSRERGRWIPCWVQS